MSDNPEKASRNATALALAGDLLDDIELTRLQIPQLVLKASRLARLTRDPEAQRWLNYELGGYPDDSSVRADLLRAGRLLVGGVAYRQSVSALFSMRQAHEARLSQMNVTSWSGDAVLLASRQYREDMATTAASIATLGSIEGSILARVHAWVTLAYHQLLFSDMQADLFAASQAAVDGRLTPLVGTALDKIESIAERLRDGDPESVSQAATTIRRLVDSTADALFPPRDDPYVLSDTVTLQVKASNVLNRLQAYVADRTSSRGRRDRLRRMLSDIYERASSGAHAEVDVDEARFLFLQTYVILGELLALKEPEQPTLGV